MDRDLRTLAEGSGELVAVSGLPAEGGGFTALAFQFASGVLHLRCDDDTDEVIVGVLDAHADYPPVSQASFGELVGMKLESAWVLTNQRGYADGFQLRVTADAGREETRQFEVAASRMDVNRVVLVRD